MYLRFDARVMMAVTRGKVLLARGEAQAALLALESAAAAAKQCGMATDWAQLSDSKCAVSA